jgi:hypothetical protein
MWIWRLNPHRSSTRLSPRWVSECLFCIPAVARGSGISLHWKFQASTKAQTRRFTRCVRLLRACLPRRVVFGAQQHARSSTLVTSCERQSDRHALLFDPILWSGSLDLALRWQLLTIEAMPVRPNTRCSEPHHRVWRAESLPLGR